MTASTTRRSVLAAAGSASAAVALAACGSGGGESSGGSDSGGKEGGEGGAALAKTSEIPKGGGMIFKEQKVVVTRPSGSDVLAFSAKCTHKGCLVSEVKGGEIICPCHDSKFDISDGSVKDGPATKPLAAAKITVDRGSIHLA